MPKRYPSGIISSIPYVTSYTSSTGFYSPSTTVQLVATQSFSAPHPVFALGTGGDSTYNIPVGSYTYKVHVFLSSGTLSFTAGSNSYIEYIAVGGGGGGQYYDQGAITSYTAPGGPGGGGGYLENNASSVVGNDFQGPPFYVNAGESLSIVVGGGGSAVVGAKNSGINNGNAGSNTTITGLRTVVTAFGGGAGALVSGSGARPANNGGNAGGAGYVSLGPVLGIGGFTLSNYPRQGYDSVNATNGAVTTGSGSLISSIITGTSVTYSIGGILGPTVSTSYSQSVNYYSQANAPANLGFGGTGGYTSGINGLGAYDCYASNGGSGIVIIRYRIA